MQAMLPAELAAPWQLTLSPRLDMRAVLVHAGRASSRLIRAGNICGRHGGSGVSTGQYSYRLAI